MMPLTSEERKLHLSKKNVIYAKMDLVLIMAITNIIKLEIIVIILENIEELFMIFAIKNIKYQKKFL